MATNPFRAAVLPGVINPTQVTGDRVISSEAMQAVIGGGSFVPRTWYTVATQDPPAGSRVPRGSDVTVTLVNLYDISFASVPVSTPSSIDSLSVAAATQMVAASPELKEVVANPEITLSSEAAADLINRSSAGVLGEPLAVRPADATRVLSAFRFVMPRP